MALVGATLLIGFLGLLVPVSGQVAPPAVGTDSVTAVAGERYAAGGLYRSLAGAGYRDLWTTPIRVAVADLRALGGGLTARRVGGGMTTRTLHLDGADGRRYVLRSVDKVPADLIGEFEGTPLEGVLQDQMSSFHPSGALIVAPLLDAVDVLHVTPRLVVVPDDPLLGEFRSEFAGMLALFEERPEDGPEGTPGFAGSLQIIQTDRLFDVVEEEPGQRVSADELLRGRLVDLMVGDRDRSTNNHLWARVDEADGGALWRPIPRDRDQAFVQFDGILKGLARYYDRRLIPFEAEYPSVAGLTRNAWDIDRSFLVSIPRSAWDETVADVQTRLTDVVIDDAVRMMPPEHYALIGERLARELRQRRDHLPEAADELYRVVFQNPDIHLSDEAEDVMIVRLGDGSVAVEARIDGAGSESKTSYERTFEPDETSDVRLYLHGGDDRAVVLGDGPEEIRVRVIGGGGQDELVDSSRTSGDANLFYDRRDETVVTSGPGTRFHDREVSRPFSWHEEDRMLDWGTLVIPEPRFGYDEDRGLVLIAGIKIRRYGFLKEPYASRLQLRAGWAFGGRDPIVEYRQFQRGAVLGRDLLLRARWSGLEVMSFYGAGNDVPEAGSREFHKVRHRAVTASIGFSIGNDQTRTLSLGPVFEYSQSDTTVTGSFVGATRPYGSGGFAKLGLETGFILDERDVPGAPARGYVVEGGGRVFANTLDVDRGAYGEVHGTVSAYLSPGGGNPTLAFRAGGKKLWGTYPFADAAFIGGTGSVRGLREQRYAGDASLYGSAELRLKLARLWLFFPTDIGVFGLGDIGRAYLSGETSDTWHRAYGGGVWIAPIRRTSTVQLSAARTAAGEMRIYVGLGFAY